MYYIYYLYIYFANFKRKVIRINSIAYFIIMQNIFLQNNSLCTMRLFLDLHVMYDIRENSVERYAMLHIVTHIIAHVKI